MATKIFSSFPQLISKPRKGWWKVTANYTNGKTVTKIYHALSPCEAKRAFLVKHGKVCGTIQATFLREEN